MTNIVLYCPDHARLQAELESLSKSAHIIRGACELSAAGKQWRFPDISQPSVLLVCETTERCAASRQVVITTLRNQNVDGAIIFWQRDSGKTNTEMAPLDQPSCFLATGPEERIPLETLLRLLTLDQTKASA